MDVVTTAALTGGWPCSKSVTGFSQFTNALLSENRPPAKTDPKASRIIGTVMDFGDSCGCGIRPGRASAAGSALGTWSASGRAASALAEEGHQHHAGHVVRGEPGAQQGDRAEDQPSAPPFAKAASMILSLDQKPDRPGKPMMAR